MTFNKIAVLLIHRRTYVKQTCSVCVLYIVFACLLFRLEIIYLVIEINTIDARYMLSISKFNETFLDETDFCLGPHKFSE